MTILKFVCLWGVLGFAQLKEDDFQVWNTRPERNYFRYVEKGRYLYGVHHVKPASVYGINRSRRLK